MGGDYSAQTAGRSGSVSGKEVTSRVCQWRENQTIRSLAPFGTQRYASRYVDGAIVAADGAVVAVARGSGVKKWDLQNV